MAKSKVPYLSVVIPCYNEEKNIQRGALKEVDDYLKKQKYSSEVIISDDESSDNSLALTRQFARRHPRFRVLANKHGGKPFAVRAGIRRAKGEIILFSDFDQSTPLNQMAKLLPFFEKGFDVVIGSRGSQRQGFSLLRQMASDAFRLIRQALLLRKITDTQCGFKAFKNEVAKDLFSRLLVFKKGKKAKGWKVGAFDVELLFIAQKRGYRTAEVPVKWQDRDAAAEIKKGKGKFFEESLQMFKEVLRVRLSDWQGAYN